MKKVILIFLSMFFCCISYIDAQEQENYYSIDDYTYPSDNMRDSLENLLWQRVDSNIILIRMHNNLPKKDIDQLQKRFDSHKDIITTFRKQNEEIYKKYSDLIKSLGIPMEGVYASNNEYFYMKEMADVYDVILDEFNYLFSFTEHVTMPENADEKFRLDDLDSQSFSSRFVVVNILYAAKAKKIISEISSLNTD